MVFSSSARYVAYYRYQPAKYSVPSNMLPCMVFSYICLVHDVSSTVYVYVGLDWVHAPDGVVFASNY